MKKINKIKEDLNDALTHQQEQPITYSNYTILLFFNVCNGFKL